MTDARYLEAAQQGSIGIGIVHEKAGPLTRDRTGGALPRGDRKTQIRDTAAEDRSPQPLLGAAVTHRL